MVEFFQSIGNWFLQNKDEIVLFFTSGSFITFLTTVVMFIKQLKVNKKNNATNEGLKASLDGAVSIANDVVSIRDNSKATNDQLTTVQNDLEAFKKETYDAFDVIVQKMNAVLEVQSLVYSTIKDETIRKNINGILIDAKYAETATRASLEAEIEALKKKVSEKIEVIKETVEDATVKVKKTVSNNKSSVPRY